MVGLTHNVSCWDASEGCAVSWNHAGVLGYLKDCEQAVIESRHLGLVTAERRAPDEK